MTGDDWLTQAGVTDVLLQSQKNDALLLITEVGLNPVDFEWREDDVPLSTTIGQLYYRRDDWWFSFDRSARGRGHYARFSPGEDTLIGERDTIHWENQLRAFKSWLQFLKREIEAPDLWALLNQDPSVTAALTQTPYDDSAFAPQELLRIAESLKELKAYAIANYEFTAAQSDELTSRLDYLETASGRVSRKDWATLVIGTLMSYLLTVGLPPETAHGLFRTALQLLSWAFRSLPSLNP